VAELRSQEVCAFATAFWSVKAGFRERIATAMRKLRAKSVADLVRIAVQAEPLTPFPREVDKAGSGVLPNWLRL
jgi:hypothetical protein